MGRALAGMPFADMAPRPDLADGKHLLAKPGTFYLCYLPEGGRVTIDGVPDAMAPRWFDPRTGEFSATGSVQQSGQFTAPSEDPWVLVVGPRQ